MKKFLCLLAALCLLLCACAPASTPNTTTAPITTNPPATNPPATNPPATNPPATEPPTTEPPATEPPVVNPGGPTDLDFNSSVTAMEGEWKLAQVFVDGNTSDAVENALSFKISLELDPSELVDGEAYIHNQVYNLTGYLTFGLNAITSQLAADDVESYKGSTAWSDFPQGKVVKEGEFYEQPGPATMRFKDIDDYGLFLDQIAGISGEIDTTNKSMIIGMNSDGQLLLGYSEEHMERPGTSGEWVYLLIFNKA